MQASIIRLLIIAFILLSVSCADSPRSNPPPDDSPDSSEESIIQNDSYVLNPYGVAPLTGIINIETIDPVQVRLTVSGNNEKDDIVRDFGPPKTEHEIPVLGLYPGANNVVQVAFLNGEGEEVEAKEYTFSTRNLDYELPQIVINAANYFQMSDGWTFVSYYGDLRSPYQPFMFDSEGDIRWYLDYSSHPILGDLIYDNGMERLANGNLYFGDTATNKIYEIDMLGKILNSWDMPGYGFHHQVLEKPDGNFLVTVNKQGEQTTQDHVIEIDRMQNTIVNVWDLRESLQYSRRVLAGDDSNWFHSNAIEYSPDDNCIIVSGRLQGVAKLTQENEVVWILSPHYGWGFSGDGADLTNYLLQPLDASGMAITSTEVIDGFANHSDFEWSWGQHAPHLMPNGNIMLFDNGDNRNFVGYGLYSRDVEYDIDEDNMTIRQVWQYGKERGNETFSRYFSDVDYDPEDHHVFFSPGGVINMDIYGKVIELDYSTGDVIFEATIYPPFTVPVTFHRIERMPLYSD